MKSFFFLKKKKESLGVFEGRGIGGEIPVSTLSLLLASFHYLSVQTESQCVCLCIIGVWTCPRFGSYSLMLKFFNYIMMI